MASFLELPSGIPSADTLRRVLSALDPEAFRQAFVAWMQTLVGSTEGKLVAIDGKTARRSFDRANEKSALHAYAESRGFGGRSPLYVGLPAATSARTVPRTLALGNTALTERM